ncbi:glycosyltransferase family 4 protein [Methylotuvimicrobium sp. KM1]|uniref:glycosyltransferase family 4 protein n=1 Tax=Methylotuvimicrobium sp. KM1 TaxID=3377707 RepID=UPI00384C4EF8
MPKSCKQPAVWFLAIQADTGTDRFTERLAQALENQGIRTEITWLPHRAEYAPWTVPVPKPPGWATIVHINSWLHDRFIPKHLPLVATLHSCVHDPAFEPYKSFLQKQYHRFWIKRLEANAIKKAVAVTAVSHYTAQQAAKVFDRQDIIPLYNWIDLNNFQPDHRETPNTPFRLLFVGNLSRRKGADLLPAIMQRLGPDFELHYTGTAQELGAQGQSSNNLIPLGRLTSQAELISTYQQCDALLFPTRLEGLSLSALEAQACGLPINSSNATSMPEIVKDRLTGRLCPIDDIEAFAEAAGEMRNNPKLWRNMKEASRNNAELFSENAAVNRYIEIYKTLSLPT